MKPVYWKPKYGTRSSRHRAFVRQQAAREEKLKRLTQGPSLWQRFNAWLRNS